MGAEVEIGGRLIKKKIYLKTRKSLRKRMGDNRIVEGVWGGKAVKGLEKRDGEWKMGGRPPSSDSTVNFL